MDENINYGRRRNSNNGSFLMKWRQVTDLVLDMLAVLAQSLLLQLLVVVAYCYRLVRALSLFLSVLQFLDTGRCSVIGLAARVRQPQPPFLRAAGVAAAVCTAHPREGSKTFGTESAATTRRSRCSFPKSGA